MPSPDPSPLSDAAADPSAAERARYRALLDHSQDVIAVVDANGICTFSAGATEARLGYPCEWYVGRNIFEDIHPEDQAEALAAFGMCVETGDTIQREVRYRRRDGTWIWLDSIAANRLSDPSIRGIVVNTRDVTERRHLEEQMRETAKMLAVARLSGGIAHDFNNLLTVINGYSELLAQQLDPASREQGIAVQVLRAGRKAADLTRQLLTFSRPHKGRPSTVDLSHQIEAMTDLLYPLLGDNVRLEVRTTVGLPAMIADPAQVEQSVIHLAANARDAMPSGGTLMLATGFVEIPAPSDAHPGVPTGRYVALTVRDTGGGISDEARPHVFEPFFTTKTHGEGSGLGLAVVHALITQAGGWIRFETAVGIGTTFVVYWPTVPSHASRPTISEPTPSPDAPLPPPDIVRPAAQRPLVLLVDDEPAIRHLAAHTLMKAGYHVIDRAGGDEALALAADPTLRFDVLVTDVIMPGMNGRDLASSLHATRPTLPVLFMSGFTGDVEMASFSDSPKEAFLAKPFTPADLVRAVWELVSSQQDAAQK